MRSFQRISATMRRNRLAKDPSRAVLFGVCAGLARYTGLPVLFVRILTVISLFCFAGSTLLVYAALALVLDSQYADREDIYVSRSFYRAHW
ncbi:PspC domain-containing protein [Nitrospirillum sp. BR 11163]|uniref:PspC domain-containing protein n=1 Tax=Nitrospirillum sp. BR 11163 TaxID=3104323 RepID=UPI002AFFF822|nr:PspC domain-containing protein [Nitrospirillum sp. BR 11163]MEA1676986.1 PspC domain-containing protein [Nitrospirillum sp. BR 11163]